MNTVSIIGTGYVGLVTGACLSEFGMNVTCMDIDEKKIGKLKECILPIYEPGLQVLVEKNSRSGRLKFTTGINEAVNSSTTIFIAVGTPPREDGSADIQHVISAACSIAEHMDSYKVVVSKSTVPVGTVREIKGVIKDILRKRGADTEFDVVSNPEFLREGAAVRDFMHPDRIVIGTESEKAKNIMKNIYNVLYLIDTPFVFTGLETAELIKYASNAFLATKIGFINQAANLCDAVGADVNDVAKAMGMDSRIGKYFLHAGPGYGGSCFPKDTRALVRIGQEYGVDMSIVRAVVNANEYQKEHMVKKIRRRMGDLGGKVFGILGLAFKPETDDMREAPAITVINKLVENGAIVKAYDPIAMDNADRYVFSQIKIMYCSDEYKAVEDADALIIVTEWNQFRNLDLSRIKNLMRGSYFFDLRNVYKRSEVEQYGFIYEGVGSRTERVIPERILVTGGAGFIGSHLCEALLKRGKEVINIDSFNNYYDPEIKRGNVRETKKLVCELGLPEESYQVFEGDIRDMDFLEEVFSQGDIGTVIHLAAYPGVRPSINNPLLYTDVNINGTVNILECLKKYEIKKLVFASSSSVYGNNKKVPFSEDDPVDHPISPYAATKKAGELISNTYHNLYDINTACLRFFTVYGPRQRPDLAIHKFTRLIHEGKPVPFYGDGTAQRDYTYIDDIVDGILRAVEWVGSSDKRYGIFNLGESNTITLTEMVKTVEKALGTKAELQRLSAQPGDVERTFADISKSRKELGYNPHTVFEDGIKKFVEWFHAFIQYII